jgi:MFS family permease
MQAANIGLSVYLPVYMQSLQGLSASSSGIAMLGLLLGTVLGATISGRMIPSVARYKTIAVAGTLFGLICLAALALLAGLSSLFVLELLTVGVGFGTGTTFPVATVSVQNAVDQAHLGVATGVLTFLRSLGGALGVAVLGAIALGHGLPLGGESLQVANAAASSATPFAYIFLACTAAMALALIAFLRMPEKPLRGRAESGMAASVE